MQADLPTSYLVWLEKMLKIEGGTCQNSASLAWVDSQECLSSGV